MTILTDLIDGNPFEMQIDTAIDPSIMDKGMHDKQFSFLPSDILRQSFESLRTEAMGGTSQWQTLTLTSYGRLL